MMEKKKAEKAPAVPTEDFMAAQLPKDPDTGKIKQNNRGFAKALIQRHCDKGKINEAGQTVWVLNMVISMAREFSTMLDTRDLEIRMLKTQLEMQQEATREALSGAQRQVDEVTVKLRGLELQLDDAQTARLAAERELGNRTGGLQAAQDAAVHAINECALLAQGVRAILDRQSVSRKALAHRVAGLKDTALTRGQQLRALREREREATCRLRAKERQLSMEQNTIHSQEDALAAQAKTCEELQLETYAAKQETLQAREKLKRIERARRAAASAKEVRSAAVDRLKKSTL